MVVAADCSHLLTLLADFSTLKMEAMFLRNVGSHKIYTAPHPRRRHSSKPKMLYLTSKASKLLASSWITYPFRFRVGSEISLRQIMTFILW
jgi:hypothetical protein